MNSGERVGRLVVRTALAGLMLGTFGEIGCATPSQAQSSNPISAEAPIIVASNQDPPKPVATAVVENSKSQNIAGPKTEKSADGNKTTITYPSGSVEVHERMDSQDMPMLKGKPILTTDYTFPKGNGNFESGSIQIGITPEFWQESSSKRDPTIPLFLVLNFGSNYGSLVRFSRRDASSDLLATVTVGNSKDSNNAILTRFEIPLPGSSRFDKTHRFFYEWGGNSAGPWSLDKIAWDNQPLPLPAPKIS